MTAQDRLPEIIEHLTDHQDIHEDDGWWLLGLVDAEAAELATELAAERTLHQQTLAEVDRLRGRLKELEWGRWDSECPACGGGSDGGDNHHRADCWLADELRPPTTKAPPEGGASSVPPYPAT